MKEKNKNILIGVLIGIIVILMGLCVYLAFFKKEETKKDNNQVSENTDKNTNNTSNNKIEISTKVGSYVGNMYLDTTGKVYFELSNELRKDKKYEAIVNQEIKINELNVIDLNEQGIKKIEYLVNGQAGYGYYTMLTEDNNLYVIDSEQIERNSVLKVIKPSLLRYVKSTGIDSDEEGASAYIINKNGNKTYIYDAIEKNISIVELINNKQDTEIDFNGKTLKIKIVSINDGLNGDLYIDNKKVATYDYDNIYLYVTSKYILISWPGAQAGEIILGYINEDGKYYEFRAGEFVDLYQDGVNLVGYLCHNEKITMSDGQEIFEFCSKQTKSEFVYENNKLTTKEVK